MSAISNNIDLNKVNAARTLTDFSNYAADQKKSAVINFSGTTRTFTVNERDWARGFFAWSVPTGRDTAANNETRDAFKTALLTLFDKQSLDGLPKSVRNVLKKGSFDGAGRPLLAHRIKDIMAEVVKTDDYKNAVADMKKAEFENQIHDAATSNDDLLDTLPGKDKDEKLAAFKNLCTTARKKKGLSPSQTINTIVPAMCFKVQKDRLNQVTPDLIRDHIKGSIAKAKRTNDLNHVTSVNALMLRELQHAKITINGVNVDSEAQKLSKEKVNIKDVDESKLTDDVWTCRDTSKSADNANAVAIHKELCKAIPGKEMREFVSTMLSAADGIKGFFDKQVEKNGTDEDQLGLYGNREIGPNSVYENSGIIVTPLQNIGEFNISTNEQGDVKIGIKFQVGTREGMTNTIYCKTDFDVTINLKNELDDQGHPTIANIDIKAE